MSEWKETTLAELCTDISYGYTESANYDPVGPKFLRITDIASEKLEWKDVPYCKISEDNLKKYRLFPGDIVIARTGATTGANYTMRSTDPKDVVFASYLIRYKINPDLANPFFVGHVLRSESWKEYVDAIAGGSAQPGANAKQLGTFEILLPPLSEQQSIASILSSLDDKIDLLHRQNKTLEAMAEALFRKWFVEEAKEEWEIGTLDSEFILVMGQSPTGDTLNEEKDGIAFFQGRTDFGFRFPNTRIYTTSPTRFAKKFDTLVSVRAPVGDMNMASESCCLGRGVAAFRYKSDEGFYSYTYYKIRSLMREIKQFEDNGTVFGSIGKDDFLTIENVIPPKGLISRFQANIKSVDDKIYSNSVQLKLLGNLRDSLLPKLMSGEARIKL